MRILSFNASTPSLDICLGYGENIVAQRSIVCEANEAHTAGKKKSRQFAASLIIPTTNELLQEVSWLKSNIDIIVVGTGPGSFTGIRIAVVTARTLAQALHLPLLGISEFECHAFRAQIKEFPALIALNAGKKQYYCAHLTDSISSGDSTDTLAKYQLDWHMITHWLTEDQLQAQLADFKSVITPWQEQGSASSNSFNYAVTQSMLAHKRLQLARTPKEKLIDIFPYHLVTPLYIRNASITISSAAKTNKT
jgi:tRNA threonylcarbamoyl adenosine modification protein YeaZ